MSEPTAVCQLTEEGMQYALRYLQSIREVGWMPVPNELLTGQAYARQMIPNACVEPRSFATRREAGQYLAQQLKPLDDAAQVAGNAHLWSWLGMFYLEQMIGKDAQKAHPIACLVDPDSDSRNRSHHRLMMAYDLWAHHGEDAWLLLDAPANSMSQFTLRVVQSPEIFRSRGVVSLIHLLYADREARRLRPRALGSDQASAPPGSLPRLIAVLNQLSMTYDVYGMEAAQLLPLLPDEFDLFR